MSVVYNLGVLKHFSSKNYIWKLGIVQKSLWIFSIFLVWFFWPKMLQYPQIIYYFHIELLKKLMSQFQENPRWKDKQTLMYRTLSTTTSGPNKVQIHLKQYCSTINYFQEMAHMEIVMCVHKPFLFYRYTHIHHLKKKCRPGSQVQISQRKFPK